MTTHQLPLDPVAHHRALWGALRAALASGHDADAVAISHRLPAVRVQLAAERDAIRWGMPTERQQQPDVITRYEDLEAELWHGFRRIVTATP